MLLVNRSRRIAEFTDGTSNTLLATDVKVYNPLCGPFGPLSSINAPELAPPNVRPVHRRPRILRQLRRSPSRHTFWADGNAHETGMTTAWPPNKMILAGTARAISTSTRDAR